MAKKSARRQSEEAELEQSFREITNNSKNSTANKRKRRPLTIVAISIAVIALIFGLGVGYFYLEDNAWFNPLSHQLTVAGVDVRGLQKNEALEAVQLAVGNAYQTETMVVTVSGQTISLTPELTEVSFDIESAIDAAFDAKNSFDPLNYLSVNEAAIRAELDKVADYYKSEFVQSSYSVTGELPTLTGEVTGPDQILVLNPGAPKYTLDLEALYQAILTAYADCKFKVEHAVDVQLPDPLDLEAIFEETRIPAVDSEMDRETFEVSQHTYGYQFDLEEAKKLLSNCEYGTEIEIPFAPVEPEVTFEELSSLLFRDVLGTYTAYSSSQYNRDINLKLSCQAINGVVLFPGDTFSYNATLGERTPEKGYKPAAGYMGTEVVDSYGGGICQASSSLYYCSLIADIEIIERHNHGYASAYMPLGMDATVDWSGPDLKIRNTTEYPIKIEAYAYGGTVTVTLLGTDTKDYYVKMSYEVLEVIPYETIYKEMDADNKDGYKDGDEITSPYTGYKVRTYMSKYDKETDELLSTDFIVASNYWKRDKEVCKIKVPEPTTPPEVTEPDVTDPPTVTEPEETDPPVVTEPEETDPPVVTPDTPDPSKPIGGGNIAEDA